MQSPILQTLRDGFLEMLDRQMSSGFQELYTHAGHGELCTPVASTGVSHACRAALPSLGGTNCRAVAVPTALTDSSGLKKKPSPCPPAVLVSYAFKNKLITRSKCPKANFWGNLSRVRARKIGEHVFNKRRHFSDT